MLFSKVERLSSQAFGRLAEKKAKAYLIKKCYRFIEANFHTRDGEIDLIFYEKETLVFVEVRAKRSLSYGTPEETIDTAKLLKCKKAAMKYLYDHKLLDTPCRFDAVTLSYLDNKWSIEHYKNILD